MTITWEEFESRTVNMYAKQNGWYYLLTPAGEVTRHLEKPEGAKRIAADWFSGKINNLDRDLYEAERKREAEEREQKRAFEAEQRRQWELNFWITGEAQYHTSITAAAYSAWQYSLQIDATVMLAFDEGEDVYEAVLAAKSNLDKGKVYLLIGAMQDGVLVPSYIREVEPTTQLAVFPANGPNTLIWSDFSQRRIRGEYNVYLTCRGDRPVEITFYRNEDWDYDYETRQSISSYKYDLNWPSIGSVNPDDATAWAEGMMNAAKTLKALEAHLGQEPLSIR